MPTPLTSIASDDASPTCIENINNKAYFIEFVPRKDTVYGFPYAHLISYLLEPNPALDQDAAAPAERLSLWFASHQVIVAGWRLDSLRNHVRRADGLTVLARDARYANLQPAACFVSLITILDSSS